MDTDLTEGRMNRKVLHLTASCCFTLVGFIVYVPHANSNLMTGADVDAITTLDARAGELWKAALSLPEPDAHTRCGTELGPVISEVHERIQSIVDDIFISSKMAHRDDEITALIVLKHEASDFLNKLTYKARIMLVLRQLCREPSTSSLTSEISLFLDHLNRSLTGIVTKVCAQLSSRC